VLQETDDVVPKISKFRYKLYELVEVSTNRRESHGLGARLQWQFLGSALQFSRGSNDDGKTWFVEYDFT
jgi:hypothetical protein